MTDTTTIAGRIDRLHALVQEIKDKTAAAAEIETQRQQYDTQCKAACAEIDALRTQARQELQEVARDLADA